MKRLDPYTKLFEDRIIFLGVQVDDASADDVIAQLIVLESQDPDRDILMYINSPGGSFTALTAIYDTMQYVRPDIQTVCLGQAASAAAVLLGGGRAGQAVRAAERAHPDPPAGHGGHWRPGERHRDPGQRGAADAHVAGGDAGASTPAARSSRSSKDIERDKILTADAGQGVRPDRRGARQPQGVATPERVGVADRPVGASALGGRAAAGHADTAFNGSGRPAAFG